MTKLVVIGGPTASGKTDIAAKIAKKFNGELINADSRQIYKYLDIGTNKGKISQETRPISTRKPQSTLDGVPIHLVSFLEPNKRFSVFEYKLLAEKAIADIVKRGKLPILVGGTGLYIDSIIKNYELRITQPEAGLPRAENYDKRYRKHLESLNLQKLQDVLRTTNFPPWAKAQLANLNDSDKNNPRRLIRLIEKSRGGTKNDVKKMDGSSALWSKYKVLFLYPEYDLSQLKQKIEDRVEQMFKEGFVDETKRVLDMGYPKDSVALQGIGYREVIRYIKKEISLETCKEFVKTSHKQYARRQRTWFEGEGRGYKLVRVSTSSESYKIVKEFLNNT